MKIKKLVYSIFLIVIVIVNGYSQKLRIEAADKKYEENAYLDAIKGYEHLVERGYGNEKIFQKLANSYYFTGEFEKAEKWYGELFVKYPEQEAEYYYKYSQSLKSMGKYDKSNEILDKFSNKYANDIRANLYVSHKSYLEEIKANSARFDIKDAGINSTYSEYGSSFMGNSLVFTSSRDTGFLHKRVFLWTNQSFTNLYSAEIAADGNLSEPKRFGGELNSKFNESSPAFTKDGKTVYFTRNNFLDGEKGVSTKKITFLKIYQATLENDEWVKTKELPFCSDEYNVAHPALSPDGKTLFFVSDMPGTFGQSDLYKVAVNQDGTFGTPENLGPTINTEGKETFPFFTDDNELYFATDGHQGLGGLDVFVSKIGNDGIFRVIKNVGTPVNGKQDDFAYVIDTKTRKGFFTSNRTDGKGSEDIYKFTENIKLVFEQELKGVISDKETKVALAGVKVSLFDENAVLIKEGSTNEKGEFDFKVECNKKYLVRAEKEYYEVKEETVNIANTAGKIDFLLDMKKHLVAGNDLAKVGKIPSIYFDRDKSEITESAASELVKIVSLMKEFPKMAIDIRSHTDSRKDIGYNEKLSERRAKATVKWLVNNGVDSSRLTSKGYGETQLVNKCSDDVECTEEEHQANRRSEFIVISVE